MDHAKPGSRHAVIFDLDGTLVDSGADIAAAANVARTALGLPPLAAEVAIGYVGDGVQKLLERVLAHGGASPPVTPGAVDRALESFADHYAAHLLDHTVPYPGITELLVRLQGRPLFVATNKPRSFTLAILTGLGLADHFVRVVAGDDAPERKPAPAHLAACLEGTGLSLASATMVGDSPNDILAARAAGARSVAVTWGLVAPSRLAAADPDALVSDADGLARALGLDR